MTFSYKSKISFVETPISIAKLMVELISKDKKAKILDTGCGKGVFLAILAEKGYNNVEGIELDRELASFCKNKYKDYVIYNIDFLDFNSKNKYEVIIGNPPYLHFNSLPINSQKKVANITGTRESDIYYSFIIKAVDLLKEGGELIYIIPYGFMYATHAKNVRMKLLENGYIDLIIDLDESRLFSGENPEVLILKYTKDKNAKNKPLTKILRLKVKNERPVIIAKHAISAVKSSKNNLLFEYHEEKINDPDKVWSSFPSVVIPKYVLLKDIAFVGVGMVSGFEKAFRIKQYKESEWQEYKDVIFPFVKAEHCKGFWVEGKTNYLLLDEQINNEKELKKRFPKIYNNLLPWKELMKERYLSKNKKWFNWQALRNFEKFKVTLEQFKIFVPTLDRSTENRFSITKEQVYPSGDVIAIIPQKEDPFFILGYLNSEFFRNYYYAEGARRGQRIAYTQRILSNTKIPLFSEDIKGKISMLAQKIVIEHKKKYRKEIDKIISLALKKNMFPKDV